MIDLRSDTITKPTPEMRKAIYEAEVGDAVFGGDPTVRELESKVADLLGKEGAIYMPSGTMTNQVAIRTHTEPGDEVILDKEAHVYYYEAGAPAAIAGVILNLVNGVRGIFNQEDVRKVLRPKGKWFAPSKLICLENTHNRGGGSIWPIEKIAGIREVADEQHLKMHLDGARLWNASAATGIAEKEYAQYFDSVSVCFSKGLGAPLGSALCGSKEFLERANRFRTQMGGGMRQAGMMAAGAIYALDHHRERLVEDHRNARKLAELISQHPRVEIEPRHVETNIIIFDVQADAAALADALYQRGVWIFAVGHRSLRAVTHLHISEADIDAAAEIILAALENMPDSDDQTE